MQIPAGKIEKAASSDDTRPALTHVHLTTDADGSRWLEATDSYKLVRVQAFEADDDADGLIPSAAFVEARKLRGGAGRVSSTSSGAVTYSLKAGGVATTQTLDAQFPKTAQLFPADATPAFTVGINAKYLADVAAALGSDELRLAFQADDAGKPNPLKPIVVRRVHDAAGEHGKGLIMPIRPKA